MSGYYLHNNGVVDDDSECLVNSAGCKPRPVVVIDPEDQATLDRLGDLLERHNWRPRNRDGVFDSSADLADALRSLIAPPKPDEPTGLGAVVEDGLGQMWVRRSLTCSRGWSKANAPLLRAYDDIPAVKVLSEGVTTDA